MHSEIEEPTGFERNLLTAGSTHKSRRILPASHRALEPMLEDRHRCFAKISQKPAFTGTLKERTGSIGNEPATVKHPKLPTRTQFLWRRQRANFNHSEFYQPCKAETQVNGSKTIIVSSQRFYADCHAACAWLSQVFDFRNILLHIITTLLQY